MKVIVEQKAGADYPSNLKVDAKFVEECKTNIRRRLELRPEDTVDIYEGHQATCPDCGTLLEKRKFVDTWKEPEHEPGDVNEDLYCPKCQLRWVCEMAPHYFYVKLSEEDKQELIELYEFASTTPMILFSYNSPDLATSAWQLVRKKMDELGKKYGFDPKKMKGISKRTGEIHY